MKRTKLITALLALLLLCGCLPLFSACAERVGVAKVSGKRVEVDIEDYSVVFAEDFGKTQTLTEQSHALNARIASATGKLLTCTSDAKTRSKPTDPEILLGLTDRAESREVHDAIKGDGFAIRVEGNKIVIVGTSQLLTLQAMSFFAEHFLGNAQEGGVLSLPERVKADRLDMVLLADSEGNTPVFVYDAGLSTEYNTEPVYVHHGQDYPYTALEEVENAITTATGSKQNKGASKVQMTSDEAEAAEREFTMGIVKRETSTACLRELEGNEYGFFVRDGQFVMTAWNDAALFDGNQVLLGLLKDATVQTETGKAIFFPEGFKLTGISNPDWVTDFPKPEGEGILLTNTLDTNDNSLQYYYTGEGVGPASYEAYCQKLADAGYALLTDNEIEESLFRTYVAKDKSHSLYVAYNAFAHQGEYDYSWKYEKCFRIVSSPADSVTLPDSTLLDPNQTYKRKTVSAITTMEILDNAAGMCYIITLEDGRFVVFDGGGINYNVEGAGDEHTKLWNLLRARNEQITALPTSSSNPVHIAAWVITHSHWDHYHAFTNLLSGYGPSGELRMDYLIGNFPSESAIWPVSEDGILLMGRDYNIASFQSKVTGGFKYIKVHAGQKLYLANLEIEVLTTYDDLNPYRIDAQNDTNTVLRFSMYTTNESGQRVGEPVTSLWAGDSNKRQSRHMCAMYGSYLQSDMVQMAHHGNIGCEKDFYTNAAATVLWFPIFVKHFDLFLSPAWTASYEVNKHAVTLPSTKYIYVSGTWDITLPFSAVTGQPDYDNIFDGMTGEKIAYDNKACFNSTERFQ